MSNLAVMEKKLLLPSFAWATEPKEGHELVDFIGAPGGGARGYNTEGDVLTQTVDGRPLNDLWAEFQTTMGLANERRQTLIDLLTFSVTNVIEDVAQVAGDDFEEASEFGEPKSLRPSLAWFSLAYDFKWYDIAARFTWKFLAEATAPQVEAINASVLEADNRLVFKKVMQALFKGNANRSSNIRGQNYTVYGLYNADGTVPPEYKGSTFPGSHTHYLASDSDSGSGTGAAKVSPQELEDLIEQLRHHGYSAANGTQLVFMVNPTEGKVIRSFRAGTSYKPTTGGDGTRTSVATWDFIPATNQPPMIVPNAAGLLGTQPSGSVGGLPILGSYGPAVIVEEDYVPVGYILLIGSGGAGNLGNPVGIREHVNPALRGLRLVGGPRVGYPLIDSFYQRGFGTGIRQRGGAAIMQITTASTYTAPTNFD
jgi:hypothetical protein